MRDRRWVRWGVAARLGRRIRYGWLVVLVAGAGIGFGVGSIALADSPGPTLSLDQGFNGGQPVPPTFPADYSGGSPGGVEFASAIQPDGKVIVVGQNSNGTDADFDVARYNADGTLDTSFGTGGYVQVAPTAGQVNFAAAVAVDPQNGDIVIAGGDISGPDVPELVRLTPSGTPDTSFGTNGSVVDSADQGSYLIGLVIDSSHQIVTLDDNGVVSRYTANGTLDTTFGTGGHTGQLVSFPQVGSEVLALQPADGKILVAGTHSGAGTVVRLNTNGTLDSTFGTGGSATLTAGTTIGQMTLEGTSIVVGGSDSSGNGMLARLTPTGTLDTLFGTASGYDTLTPPSGYTEHVDALFYDPGSTPGLVYCLYQSQTGSQTGVCSTLGINGQTMGTPVTLTGTPKDGGYSFIPDSHLGTDGYGGFSMYQTVASTGSCTAMRVGATAGVGEEGNGVVAGHYGVTVTTTATGGTAPYHWSSTANNPLGSTPTTSDDSKRYWTAGTNGLAPGTYSFTFTATDSSTPACIGSVTITVTVGSPTTSGGGGGRSCSLRVKADAGVGEEGRGVVEGHYGVTVTTTATGGTAPYHWSRPSNNPLGSSRTTGDDSKRYWVAGNQGLPPGTYDFTFTVTDSSSPPCTATVALVVVVGPGATVADGHPPTVAISGNGTGTLPVMCDLPRNDVCHTSGEIDTGLCTTPAASGICENHGASTTCTSPSALVCTEEQPRAVDAIAKRKHKVKILGHVHGKVAGGKRGRVRFRLNGAGLRLLLKHHTLRERLLLTITDRAGNVYVVSYLVTLRLSP